MKSAIWMATLLAGWLGGVAAAELSDSDSGRLLRLEIGGESARAGTYLVFLENAGNGQWKCRPLSGGGAALCIYPNQARVLPFDESVPVFVVSFYAVRELYGGLSDRPALQLARELGGDRRVSAIERFWTVSQNFQRGLQTVLASRSETPVPVFGASYARSRAKNSRTPGAPPAGLDAGEATEEWRGRVEELITDFEGFKLISAAVGVNDWLLAVAMFQATRRTVLAGLARSRPSAADRTRFLARLDDTGAELAEKFASYCRTPTSRTTAFRDACPRARGIWSMSPPADFAELCGAFEKACQSFARLDRYSESIDFEQWGNAMLDVLLFSPDNPALIRQFDDALAAYLKRGGGK